MGAGIERSSYHIVTLSAYDDVVIYASFPLRRSSSPFGLKSCR